MQPTMIKQKITAKGLSFSVIASALGVSPVSVSQVANRTATSERIAKAIAKALDLSLYEAFPEYRQKSPKSKMNKQEKATKIKELKKVLG